MKNDCIFTTLLLCDIKTIANCITTNKLIHSINTEYLWKTLCERDFSTNFLRNFLGSYSLVTYGYYKRKWHNKYKSYFMIRNGKATLIFDEAHYINMNRIIK